MCGLVGVAGVVDTPQEKVFKDLLIMDVLRGHHSTGIFRVKRALDEVDVIKELGVPQNLLDSKQCQGFFTPWSRILAGHNRYATKGRRDVIHNAHPFQHGKITGMHNGTLRNQSLLDDWKNFEVDSENIIYSMDKIGEEETIAKLNGAFALVWYNKETKELNFIRNKERTLFYAFGENGKSIYWASEEWMITSACARQGVNIGNIMPFAPMNLYRLHLPEHPFGSLPEQVLGKFRVKALQEYVPPAGGYYQKKGNWGRGGYNGGYYGDDYDDDIPFSNSVPPHNRRKSVAALPRPQDNSYTPSRGDYDNAKGKYVYFRVIGTVEGQSGGDYIRGLTTTQNASIRPGLECRVYFNKGSEGWDKTNVTGFVFRAEVKDAKSHHGLYLLLDRGSVRRWEEQDKNIFDLAAGEEYEDTSAAHEVTPMTKAGRDGKLVTRNEWYKMVKHGCAICTDPIEWIERETVAWVMEDQPICLFCQTTSCEDGDVDLAYIVSNSIRH